MKGNNSVFIVALLSVLLLLSFLLHLSSGETSIDFMDFFHAVFSFDEQQTQQVLIRELRIPRLTMAVVAGGSLAVSGMMMQSLFQNPLAGPYVLGISAGSSLFVAIAMLLSLPTFLLDIGILASAILGAALFSLVILFLSYRIQSQVSLLLVGLMLGSFTGALVGILQSLSQADQLKQFVFWSMGSLQNASYDQLFWIVSFFILGSMLSILTVKPLNALVLGERSAHHLGIQLKKTRLLLISITALLTGVTTAFCGPLAFVGLAVPNLTKMIFQTQNHRLLLPGNLLIGALFMVLADSIIQLMEPVILIPINALTSLVGAPFVMYIVFKKQR